MIDPTAKVPAVLHWCLPQKDGPERPTENARYSTIALFPARERPDAAVRWSVIVDLEGVRADDPTGVSSRVGFLSPDAPGEWLAPGEVIELYEGARQSTRIRILG
jgi:hypothetical protein